VSLPLAFLIQQRRFGSGSGEAVLGARLLDSRIDAGRNPSAREIEHLHSRFDIECSNSLRERAGTQRDYAVGDLRNERQTRALNFSSARGQAILGRSDGFTHATEHIYLVADAKAHVSNARKLRRTRPWATPCWRVALVFA
jgi:hypothetical protein